MRWGAWPVLGALALGACSLGGGDYFGRVPTPDPTHFRWCGNGEPESIDPALATSTTDNKLEYALFDGLTTHDPQGGPKPSLATSWDVSPDQRTFTFHLREDAHWSNGRALTADDFVYSWYRVLDPRTASPTADSLWRIRHGQALNEGRAKVVLADSGPFHAGEVVAIDVPAAGTEAPPDPNLRRARAAVPLRAEPREGAASYATSVAGTELAILELGGPARDWAYLYDGTADGVYGWAPLAALFEPSADRDYDVTAMDDPKGTPPRRARLKGRVLLALPEAIGVRAPDSHTLVVTTEGPCPYLIDLTLQRPWRPAPRETVSRWPTKWARPGRIVTSGPFHLVEWQERDRFEMVKSKTFWGAADVRLERITVYTLDDQAANAAMYFDGRCDAIQAGNVPASYLPVLAGEGGGAHKPRKDYTRSAYLGIYYYLFNAKKLDNVHLRRALSHALDRTQLPAILKGGQIPTEQYSPGTPFRVMTDAQLALCGATRDTPGVGLMVAADLCYVPPMGARYDLAAAKSELAIARREMGARFPEKLVVKFNTGVDSHKAIAEWIQAEWQKNLGITVELESQEWKTFLKATTNLDYDVARMGGIGNFPSPEAEFLPEGHCGSPQSRTGFCDPKFDEAYDAALMEPDAKKRLALVQKAEQVYMDDQAVLPLYVYTQHNLQKPYVRGLAINFVDQQSMRDVWIDPDWASRPDRPDWKKHAAEGTP